MYIVIMQVAIFSVLLLNLSGYANPKFGVASCKEDLCGY